MDLHPTPFPGKRRPLVNTTIVKDRDHHKHKPPASHTQSKPKRTFGRNLSSNNTICRPSQKPSSLKPWKPSGISKNAQNPPKKVKKKELHVNFVETSIEVANDDLVVCTPVLSNDNALMMLETPYKSAENCSKCRLDRLETSSYWISQVKIAEHGGKHFVAAAFFRLALECEAQPLVFLQNELKHYRDRHGVIFMETLWNDLCRDYGLTNEQPDAIFVGHFDSKCSVKEDILEDLKAKNDETEGFICEKHSEDGLLKLSSSIDSLLKNVQDVESPSSNSKIDDLISCDSEGDTRTNKTIISTKKPTWIKKDVAIVGSSDLLKSKSIAEEQCRNSHLDENEDFVEDREIVEGEENESFNHD